MYSRLRFNDFRDIKAKFDSKGCVNSPDHVTKKGDAIGFAPRGRVVCCADCWQKWCAENAAAAFDEMSH
jgi:hypothetical protein